MAAGNGLSGWTRLKITHEAHEETRRVKNLSDPRAPLWIEPKGHPMKKHLIKHNLLLID